MNLPSFLDDQGVSYRLSHHSEAYRSQDLAQIEHISGKNVVKPVLPLSKPTASLSCSAALPVTRSI